MNKERKHIPNEIEREIKVEAGHKCTVWNCYEKIGLEKHHIDGDPSNNNKDNIIYLCATHHKMATIGMISQEECHMYKKLLNDMLEGKISHKAEEPLTPKGIEIEPESWLKKSIFWLGKRYVIWHYHDLNVNLTKEYIIFGIIGLLLFLPLVWYTQNIGKTFNASFFYIVIFSSLIGSIIIASLGLIANSRCLKCHKNFGIRRVRSIEIGRKKLDRTDFGTRYEVTYDNTYKCEFCEYQFQKRERDIETI